MLLIIQAYNTKLIYINEQSKRTRKIILPFIFFQKFLFVIFVILFVICEIEMVGVYYRVKEESLGAYNLVSLVITLENFTVSVSH